MNLRDKIIVITGGSQGFGLALAGALKNEDCRVVISSNEKECLESASKELGVDHFLADVTSFEDIKKLAEYTVQNYGRIDVWINNAGIQIAPSLVEEVDIKKLHNLFEINFFGYFYGCKVVIPYFKKQNSGVIININSTAGLEGKPNISVYSSSKFAIKGLTESLRKELMGSNINVYQIFPGGMQTDIYKEKYPDDIKEYMSVKSVVEKVIVNLKSETPEIDLVVKRPIK